MATWNSNGRMKPRARKGMRISMPPVSEAVRKVVNLKGASDSSGWRARRLWRTAITPRPAPARIRAAGQRQSWPGALMRSRPKMNAPSARPVSQNPGQSKGRLSSALRSGM